MKEGDDADAMYFIVVGALEVLINKGTLRVTMLRRNQFFGESGLLKTKSGHLPKRNATVRTLMFCELRILCMDDFDRIIHKFPVTLQNIQVTSKRRATQTRDTARRRSVTKVMQDSSKESNAKKTERRGRRRGSLGTNPMTPSPLASFSVPQEAGTEEPATSTLMENVNQTKEAAGTDRNGKWSAGEVTCVETISAPDETPSASEMPGRRIQHKPMMDSRTSRRPKAKRNSNSNILLTQPVRLRNEKIKTVPDLALSVTRWQAGMNAK